MSLSILPYLSLQVLAPMGLLNYMQHHNHNTQTSVHVLSEYLIFSRQQHSEAMEEDA